MSDLKKLEERLTFYEQYVDSLNQVVIDLQRRLTTLESQNQHVSQEVTQLLELQKEAFDPVAEKPPHY